MISDWFNENIPTKEILFRYMLVGLEPLISGMTKFEGMSFEEIIKFYCEDSDTKRKFFLFEKYYGKKIENFDEYYELFTDKSIENIDAINLFEFIIEGKKMF